MPSVEATSVGPRGTKRMLCPSKLGPSSTPQWAWKPAADLVVHPAAGHGGEGAGHHLEGPRVPCPSPEAQHELPDHGLGELRRLAESPLPLVEVAREALVGVEQDLGGEEGRGAA